MNERPSLADLGAFAAIVAHRSFRKAADEAGLSPSTLSHMMRLLEARMGVRLLHRTTRSVSPTEAGERLLARLRPALHDLELALGAVDAFRGAPSGVVRINAPETAARMLLEHVVPVLLERHPAVHVDLVTEGRLVDIVAEGFDAGVRLGESVPQDMIAVRFGLSARFLVVASPAYLARASAPQTPDDLAGHRCIRHRMPSGRLHRWEFERYGQESTVDVSGQLTLDDLQLMARAAAAGLGFAYVPEQVARAWIDRGALQAVLESWCPPIPGFFLYHPSRRQPPSSLMAFIQITKELLP